MKNILFTLALLISFSSFGQINIEKPKGWIDMNTKNAVAENLKRIQFDSLASKDLLNEMEIKQASVLYFFTKYDPKTYPGVCPTINATLLKNIKGYSLEDLRGQGKTMLNQLRNAGMEEVFLVSLDYINLQNGKKAVELKSTFKLPGSPEKIISRVYMYMISEDWFIQLSLSTTDNDNCDDIFKTVLKNLY